MEINKITEAEVKDKVVLVRTDYNVPMENGLISDNTRIMDSLDTLRYLLDQGVKKVVIVSHLGRPLGNIVDEMRLGPIVKELESLLGQEVDYFAKPIEDINRKEIESSICRIVVLENIRFDQREEKGDDSFAKILSRFGDIFVLDGFSVAHREHASVTKITRFMPSYGGLGLIKELEGISKFLQSIKKPFWGFFGGIKLSDKLPVIKALSDKLDGVVFGSSIAIAFLSKYGYNIGDSLIAKDSIEAVEDFLNLMKQSKIKVVFPRDLIVGNVISGKIMQVFDVDFDRVLDGSIPVGFKVCEEGEAIFDIGNKSIEQIKSIIGSSKSVFWNGPFGLFEKEEFANGTRRLAEEIAVSGTMSLVGGGDTVAAVKDMGLINKYTCLSTSGGAMMEYIANLQLPGLEVLRKVN